MADEEDYSSLPLTERAVHKIWKVRQGAYDEMKKQFTSSGSESDGCFRPFIDNPGIFKKIVTDSNVVAQESGVGALCAFLEFGGSNACLRTRGTVVGPLIEKAVGSSRAGTRRNALDALLWYIELDTPEPVVEELVPFLTHRTPKLCTATTNAVCEIIKTFGAKTIPVKPFIPAIPKLFAHADKNVRAEASALVVELYKWIGDSFANLILPDLKPVQQKELEEAFSQVKGETPHQQRYLKSQRDAMERQQANGIETGGGGNEEPMDEDDDEEMLDIVDPVAVLSKAPGDLDDRLGSTKWKDRKEALEELKEAFNVPKMVNEDFGDVIRLLAKCMKDANIQVVMLAANCIEQLATGLKGDFARYQSTVLGPMLERTKEKKTNVTEALGSSLDAIFKSNGMSIPDIIDPVIEHLKHKTPQVKIETAKYLIRCLKTTKVAPKPPDVKQMVDAGLKLLGETQEPVRAGGQEILGVLMKIFGERAMNPHLDSIDDIKRNKINEFCEAAEVKAKAEKPKPKPAAPAAAAPAPHAAAGARKIAAPKKLGPPGSSANPKTPRAGMGASSGTTGSATGVQNTTAGKKRLASPLKPGATPRERTERFVDEPLSPVKGDGQTPQQQRSVGGGQSRGLTGRSLTSAAQAQARAAPPPPDPKIAILEKEVEQLKKEKAEWTKEREQLQWKSQEEQGEKARLMQEINDLQLKNAQLVEDHTRDILAIKSKETQLVRAMSDVDTARVRIQKLESELDRLQLRPDGNSFAAGIGTNASAGENTGATPASTMSQRRSSYIGISSPSSPSKTAFDHQQQQQRSNHRSAQSTSSIRRSVDFAGYNFKARQSPVTEDNKENSAASTTTASSFRTSRLYDNGSRSSSSSKDESVTAGDDNDGDVAMKEAPATTGVGSASASAASSTGNFTSGIPPPTPTTVNPGAPGENWKRAVEVTTQLRARIEAMKARQNRAR